MEGRRHRRFAELRDVGAREEGAPPARQHDRPHARIGLRGPEGVHKTGADFLLEGVHGRAVGGDDGDVAVPGQIHERVHLDPP
jgi:hypothetical protein